MTESIAPPFIEVEGPIAERGAQYGRAADARVKRGAELYKGFLDARGVSWGQVVDATRLLSERLKDLYPEQHDELEAIAKGAGVDLAEVMLINGRSEVLNAAAVALKEEEKTEIDDGCTAAVALPEKTAEGRLIHCQNWDWRPECEETAVIVAVRREDGPDLLTYVEAGGLARAGFNEIGVAVTGNNLTIEGEDWSRPGVPLSVIRRLILEAPTYPEAMNAIARTPRTVSNNMIVSCAQDTGDAINLETTPDEIFWVAPEDGLLTHSNHFVSQAARAKVVDRGVLQGMDSLYRDRRVRAHLARCGSKVTIDDFKSAFSDKFGHPRAVLRTPDPTSSNQISATVATIIMDAADRVMWVRQSPYRSEEYVKYHL